MSTNHTLHTYLDTEAAAQAWRRLHWRLVSALESTCNIPGGVHLVYALGDGYERDNRHALYTWVVRELKGLGLEAASHTAPQLIVRLQRALARWELDRHEM